jgi:hypothetical protein
MMFGIGDHHQSKIDFRVELVVEQSLKREIGKYVAVYQDKCVTELRQGVANATRGFQVLA